MTELNIQNFNVENVETMDYMFKECRKLNISDLSYFNTSNCSSMYYPKHIF